MHSVVGAPDLQRALDYWMSLRNGRPMPAYADVNPGDIPTILPKLFLMSQSPDSGDFVYRLAGTALRSVYGREPTGKTIHDLFGVSIADRLVAGYRDVVGQHCIEYIELMLFSDASDRAADGMLLPYSYRRLLMPLSGDNGTSHMLMGCVEAYLPVHLSPDEVGVFLKTCSEFSVRTEVLTL